MCCSKGIASLTCRISKLIVSLKCVAGKDISVGLQIHGLLAL